MRRRRGDERGVARRRIGAEHARQVLAVDGRQDHVEQQDPRPRHLGERERVESGRGRVNRETEVFEDETYRLAELVVIVGHEDAARQTSPCLDGWATSLRRPLVRHGSVSAPAAPRERWRAEV